MASTTQDALYDSFSNAAGSQVDDLEPIVNASDELAESLQSVIGQTSGSTPQVSGQSSSSTSKSAGSEASSIATTVLESGLGLIPLVTGLIGLFTSGGSAPAALTKYVMPEKIDFEGADTGSGISAMDYDQTDAPRTYAGTSGPSPATAPAAVSPAPPEPQTNANVPAIDSQWFMDHSSDIAMAVRSAMLNMSSINDVLSDL